MAITPDLIGLCSPARDVSWDVDDVLLYAVAVGAGQDDPTRELNLTTENSDGVVTQALPTYANIVTRGRPEFELDMSKMVHAEQDFSLPNPLSTSGRGSLRTEVTNVEDKGSGALISIDGVLEDAQSAEVLARTTQRLFVRGAGGFGSSSAPRREPWVVPDRAPDSETVGNVRPEQALLYRLTGDRNPLHSDPAFAQRSGFAQPILHGMCTYGITGRLLVREICGGDPARLTGMSGRFTKPALTGIPLTVRIWVDGDEARFQTLQDGAVILDRGTARISQ
ncbi:MaoC/PaaZ C-terminal domain-containing protein [Cumulibacter soli]|uniref:MaoC/PaaZ C-terminal domain-containing protein n=1 Tax=Cumulibacter soli TaxID=2546344 RepID=UPI0010687927|nr:MaoC/PaaZ C-terminal domain-containing protein [Cumulibacter soli]